MQYLYHKVISRRLASQSGFALIVAIIAMMILIALGFFALTVSTQDIRISTRLVCERKAFSAAEAGVSEACRALDPHAPALIDWTEYDATNNPGVEFWVDKPDRDDDYPQINIPGFSLKHAWAGSVFATEVTGRDTNCNSQTKINVGVAFSPNPSDTQY